MFSLSGRLSLETRENFCESSVASKRCNPMNMVTGHCAVAYPILIFFGTRPTKRTDIRYPVIGWQSFPVYTQLPFSHWLCHETFHRVLASSMNAWKYMTAIDDSLPRRRIEKVIDSRPQKRETSAATAAWNGF